MQSLKRRNANEAKNEYKRRPHTLMREKKDEESKTLPASAGDEKQPTKKQKLTPAVDEIFAPQNAPSLDAATVPNSLYFF